MPLPEEQEAKETSTVSAKIVTAEVSSPATLMQEVEAKCLNKVFCSMYYDKKFETFNSVLPPRWQHCFNLDGVYAMIRHRNPHSKLQQVLTEFYSKTVEHMRGKTIFVEGNILYKDAPGVKEAINLMIGITTMYKLPSCVDTSVFKRTEMVSGDICPTKDVLFRYKGMLFILYGRYIYGYSMPYVRFLNKVKLGTKYKYTPEHYEDCERNKRLSKRFYWGYRRKPMISEDEIILPTISYEENDENLADYNYAFCILEETSKTLLAFSLYR